jgi:hypothetical protein
VGEVHKAHDGRLNRTVAIKRLIADDASRFQREASQLADALTRRTNKAFFTAI